MTAETLHEDSQFDNMTVASSTTLWPYYASPPSGTPPRLYSPPPTIHASSSWSNPRDVPCPEETFQIIEKHCGRAIALVGDEVKLQNLSDTNPMDTYWHCVKQNGYFGFQNPHTGRYLGHDGKGGIHAAVSHLKSWELWTPRAHRDGGYELLSPYYSHTLMVLCVGEDGDNLVRRRHGTELWEFVRVRGNGDPRTAGRDRREL